MQVPPYWGYLIWLTSQHIPVEAILRYEGWDDLRGDSQRQSSFLLMDGNGDVQAFFHGKDWTKIIQLIANH